MARLNLFFKSGGPWNPTQGVHAGDIVRNSICPRLQSYTTTNQVHTYITHIHTYIHTYIHIYIPYIHLWRLPAQLSQGQAALNVPSQHRNVSDIHAISDQINLGVPTTHHVHTYIYAYVLRLYCFHFISVLYTLSTQGRSCGLSEQLVKSRCIALLYAFLH